MDLDIRIVELIASRLCHDLVSPVGAIRNGLELIEEMNEEDESNPSFMGEAIKLIDHSSLQADRRLRVFRLAYGMAGRDQKGFGEARSAVEGWVEGSRTTLDWPAGQPSDWAAVRTGLVKVVLNTVVLAEAALTHGGTVTVAGEGSAEGGRITVTAQGRPGALSADAEAALKGATAIEDLTPRTVHAYITGRFAETYGVRLTAAPAGPEVLAFTLEW
ncbi:MAG TPA: histidine phosphotransferase family protein [Azospirillum sp.]|nr:histidine phosphotransferase family protein [Azospirillum sp.]